MPDLGSILWAALALYALMTGVFIILENRRPPSTLAWMLLFVFAPGVGLLIYLFFGRDRKPSARRQPRTPDDAICDRLIHNAHRITLQGPSLRKTRAGLRPRRPVRSSTPEPPASLRSDPAGMRRIRRPPCDRTGWPASPEYAGASP
jgi:hypothetical protein